MPDRDVSEPYVEINRPDPAAGGHHAEDAVDRDGYDEAQRAEIAEYEGDGPNDGVVMTDLQADLGGDLDDQEVEDAPDLLHTVIDTDAGFIDRAPD